jgi:hypothetical protein
VYRRNVGLNKQALEPCKVNEINSNLRKVQMIQWALIGSILIFAAVAELVCGRGSDNWTSRHWLLAGFALWAVWSGSNLRHRFLGRSRETLAKDALNPKGLKEWEAGNIIGLAVAAGGVAGWGLVVRFVLGGVLWQASLFYAAGLFLLLLWTPRMPIANISK